MRFKAVIGRLGGSFVPDGTAIGEEIVVNFGPGTKINKKPIPEDIPCVVATFKGGEQRVYSETLLQWLCSSSQANA